MAEHRFASHSMLVWSKVCPLKVKTCTLARKPFYNFHFTSRPCLFGRMTLLLRPLSQWEKPEILMRNDSEFNHLAVRSSSLTCFCLRFLFLAIFLAERVWHCLSVWCISSQMPSFLSGMPTGCNPLTRDDLFSLFSLQESPAQPSRRLQTNSL